MSVGLTLKNNELGIFVLDTVLDRTDESVMMSLDLLSEMGVKIRSNVMNSGSELMATEDIAGLLSCYDHITAY